MPHSVCGGESEAPDPDVFRILDMQQIDRKLRLWNKRRFPDGCCASEVRHILLLVSRFQEYPDPKTPHR